MNVELAVTWPVTVNAAYRTVSGRMVLSERGRKYKEQIRSICYQTGWHELGIAEPCRVTIDLEAVSPLAFDVDNKAKLLLDALESGGVIEDDKWVYSLTIVKRKSTVKRCTVFIEWGQSDEEI